MVIYYKSINNEKKQRGKITLGLILAATISFLGIVYLFLINSFVVDGYRLRDIEKLLRVEGGRQADLQTTLMEIQSLPSLEKRISDLKMVAVDKADYLIKEKNIIGQSDSSDLSRLP